MTEATVGTTQMRYYPDTTTLVVSQTDCFDAAFEPTVRRYNVTNWLDVGGRSIPVISVNGYTAEDVLRAFKEVI